MLFAQMLNAFSSFLRHSPGHIPEGNLVHVYIYMCVYGYKVSLRDVGDVKSRG